MDAQVLMPTMEGRVSDAQVGHDFAVLFRDESPGVYRTLFAYTGGRADVAEEAVAEAFARAIAHGATIRDPIAWIYRTAFRLTNEDLRRDRRRGSPEEMAGAAPAVSPPELVGVVDAMRKLSPNQRAAIFLRHVLDLDVDEVARRMGTAPPTVRVHLHRGRKRLRELLGAEEVD